MAENAKCAVVLAQLTREHRDRAGQLAPVEFQIRKRNRFDFGFTPAPERADRAHPDGRPPTLDREQKAPRSRAGVR